MMSAARPSVSAERASSGGLSRGNPCETVRGSWCRLEGSKGSAAMLTSPRPERLMAWVCRRGSFQERVLAADGVEALRLNWGCASFPWVPEGNVAPEAPEALGALGALEVLEVSFCPVESWTVVEESWLLLPGNSGWLLPSAWAPRCKSQATACAGSQLSWLEVGEVSWAASRFHRCGRHRGE